MQTPFLSGYRKCISICLAGLLLLLSPSRPRAQSQNELHVAAAADLQPVMPALAFAYEKKTGVKLVVSFASSSVLAEQILHGAPFDIFLGADFTFPERVIAANLASEKLPVPYARGTLVLWARKDFSGPLRMELLTDSRVTHIAIADQFKAPYGRAAYETLRSLKILDQVKPKLVIGENIGQTAQFVQSGNAQVGMISLTLASSERFRNDGQFVRVPEVYPPLIQTAVTMKNSPHAAAAQNLLEWMRGPEVQEHLHEFGLEPVR